MATISSGAILGIVELQGDLDPWQVAKCRFLEGLDEAEKALFEDATVGNTFLSACVAERKDAADNKLRSFLPKIQPLVSAVEGYGNAFDTYSNFASLYLAPIWGRVRVLLAIASSYGRFYSRLVDALGRIGDVLPRFLEYQKLYSHDKHLHFSASLSAAYLYIIVLCTEFTAVLRSSALRIFQPLHPTLENKLQESVERFRQHRKSVEKEAEICHMIEEKELRALVKRNSDAAEVRERGIVHC